MSTKRRVLVIALAVAIVGTAAIPARAYDTSALRFGVYPYYGFIWLARYDYASLWVSSDRCEPYEGSAWSRVRNSTAGRTDAFGRRWPDGMGFVEYRCDGRLDVQTDIRLDYKRGGTSPSGEWCESGHCSGSLRGRYGGHNHGVVAPSSWCEIWGLPAGSRCGMHAPIVHLNEERIESSLYSYAARARLLIHETGHSIGMRDYCGGSAYNGIMENGASCDNNGRWASSNWTAFDMEAQVDTYPHWPYHR